MCCIVMMGRQIANLKVFPYIFSVKISVSHGPESHIKVIILHAQGKV